MAINLFRIKEFVSEEYFDHANLHLAPQGKNFLFVYKIEGKYFAQSGDEIFGGFNSVERVQFKKGGKIFVFKYSNFTKALGLIKDSNQDYINIKGRIVGPFNKIKDFNFNENITYFILYETYGSAFALINNKKYGSYKNIYNVFLSGDGSSFMIHYKNNGREYVRKDDEIMGGYEFVRDLAVDYEKKFYAFIYKKETGEYFARINENVLGPFENCSDLHYYRESDSYFLIYKKSEVNMIQIGTFVIGGYESYSVPVMNKKIALVRSLKDKETVYHMVVGDVGVFNDITEYSLSSSEEEYVFSYNKMGQFFVVVDEYEYGPYIKISNVDISPNGKNYCFIFQKQYDNYYVNINGEIFGPYIYVSDVKVGDFKDNYGFIFTRNARQFVHVGKELHGMYESASNLILSNKGSGYSYRYTKRVKTGPLFSKLQSFISVNGDISENDADIMDFLTNSIGIVVLVFKSKGSWFVSIGDTVLGPFNSVSDWKFLPDDTLFAFKYKDSQSDFYNLHINNRKYFSRNKNLQVYFPIFSPDQKKFAFIHYSQTHYYVQITDHTYGPFLHADFPSFSPDSKIFIFKYELEDGIYLNVNGMELGPFKKAEYAFSDDKLYISYLQDNTIFIDQITWVL
ncbi:MAG: hypothetical protein R6V47_03950 [Candidatus Delongbacteria bacterium]